MLIDTHAHLNFEAYDADRAEVINRCSAKPMAVINVGAQFETSQLAVKLAGEYDFLYASVGLHPIHVFDQEFSLDKYRELITGKVVAIGETGLDFFQPTFNRAGAREASIEEVLTRQKEVFLKQIKLAKDNRLPLILHGRNGLEGRNVYLEMLEILKGEEATAAVFHCYGGDLATAKEILKQGYFLGTDGPLTFKKKAEELQQLIKEVPLDRLLIETDSPYLAPEPHRGKRNEPVYVEYVAEKIAELKELTKEEIIKATWQNAKKLFKL